MPNPCEEVLFDIQRLSMLWKAHCNRWHCWILNTYPSAQLIFPAVGRKDHGLVAGFGPTAAKPGTQLL